MQEYTIVGADGNDYSLSLDYSPSTDCLIAMVRAPNGNTHAIRVPLAPIRSAARQALSNRVGWSWSEVKKAAKGVVQKVGSKKLWNRVNDIISDPRFAKGAAMASAFFPALGVSYGAIRAASEIVIAARGGDTEAQTKIVEVIDKAKEGDATAQKAAALLSKLYQASATPEGHATVSGWIESPYRGWPEATLDYYKSPAGILRSFYKRGMER